ncbi:MAG: hypothetical protein JWO70_4324 [Betaproteobacteria bacterium]|jgi:hypothetical protein|nr:hypothetical protein [Betaproteobacteria bacterium]
MKPNDLYSGMLNSLDKVNLNGRRRDQAERHMRRAAVIVEMLLGSSKAAQSNSGMEKFEAPVAVREPQKYRAAA